MGGHKEKNKEITHKFRYVLLLQSTQVGIPAPRTGRSQSSITTGPVGPATSNLCHHLQLHAYFHTQMHTILKIIRK